MNFCYGIEEITKDQINEINEIDIEPEGEFINIDDFKEPEVDDLSDDSLVEEITEIEQNNNEANIEISQSEWSQFGLNPQLIEELENNGFHMPTEIQQKTLIHTVVHGKDLVGAAETGSGKTLAYGIPIINHILNKTEKDGVTALILVPTRELAIQVVEHLKNVSIEKYRKKIVGIFGGISVEKQERFLQKVPDIMVCTPGRLWALLEDHQEFVAELRKIRFLVLDEADRMLDQHHFKQLDDILETIAIQPNEEDIKRQTMIFSATMLEDTQIQQQFNKRKSNIRSMFKQLLKRIQFKNKKPLYINLSKSKLTATGVLEAKIECLKTEKELIVYYLSCRYPGKTIVFVNSIDAIRRLAPILSYLRDNVYGLHADMQQKQRIKNLEKFSNADDAILIASDVAARGLDIPSVDHVIHYQIPRSADIYVHRSGRTARGHGKEGVSISLVCHEEQKTFNKLLVALNREEFSDFPVDNTISSALKERLKLASEIDKLEHSKKKTQKESDWFRKAADEADIYYSDSEHSEEESMKDFDYKQKIINLKSELAELLDKKIMPKGRTAKFLTGSINPRMAEIVANNVGTFPIAEEINATAEIKRASEAGTRQMINQVSGKKRKKEVRLAKIKANKGKKKQKKRE